MSSATSFPSGLLLVTALLLLGGCEAQNPAAGTRADTQPAPDPVPAANATSQPEPYGGGSLAAVVQAIQQGIVLPFGTPVPDTSSRVVVRFVVSGLGQVADASIVRGVSPAVDEAVLAAVRDLPGFRAEQRAGQQVAVPLTLTIEAPGVATPAQRREATTRWKQTARRLSGEADSTFVRRVLPLSCPEDAADLLAYAWRPTAFGKQLFFSRRGAPNEYGTNLFVLDPYLPDTYAVQVLPVDDMSDFTYLAALFFTDADHDGRKDLLALAECSLSEEHESDDGERLIGHWNHYRTDIWQYVGPDPAGRPRYQPDPTPRPYLDDLATAAEVRRTLAKPPPRSKRTR